MERGIFHPVSIRKTSEFRDKASAYYKFYMDEVNRASLNYWKTWSSSARSAFDLSIILLDQLKALYRFFVSHDGGHIDFDLMLNSNRYRVGILSYF